MNTFSQNFKDEFSGQHNINLVRIKYKSVLVRMQEFSLLTTVSMQYGYILLFTVPGQAVSIYFTYQVSVFNHFQANYPSYKKIHVVCQGSPCEYRNPQH